MKIEQFRLEGDSMVPEKTIQTGVDTPMGLCVMNNMIYKSGSSVAIDDDALMALMQGEPADNPHSFISRPVHAFSMDGSQLGSFGNRYASKTGWPTFTSYFSAQYIMCDEERNQVYTINQKFPIISAWSGDGEELWSVFFEDIPSLPMNERNEGMPEMYLNDGPLRFNEPARPVLIGDELVLQFSTVMLDEDHALMLPDEGNPIENDFLYLFLNPETGEVNRVKEGNRLILYSAEDLIITDEPNPNLRLTGESGQTLNLFQ